MKIGIKELLLIAVALALQIEKSRSQWYEWQLRNKPLDPYFQWVYPEVTVPKYGRVKGFQVQYGYKSFLNVFLGVRYAKPPVVERRFQNPEEPDPWQERDYQRYNIWDATYYRPACPQPKGYLERYLPHFSNTSEDCLYMNIFAPNITFFPYAGRRWPVMVFIHGGGFTHGSGQMYPGQVLAQKRVVVVTFNYRLGPLGFLTTEDSKGRGNYGMLDQVRALEFIKENIYYFHGDPSRITIVGHDAGAVSVGLHLISPLSRNRGLYHRAICMSGADMCEWAVLKKEYRPRQYAYELGYKLGCPVDDKNHFPLMECLRKYRSFEEIMSAGLNITKLDWLPAGPWAPVVDHPDGFLPDTPEVLRAAGAVEPVQFMAGLVKNEGSDLVPNLPGLAEGITEEQFDKHLDTWLWRRRVWDVDRVKDAIKFEYTHWVNPENATARTQKLIDMYSDMRYGAGVDATLKSQVKYNRTYAYLFQFRGLYSPVPGWKGVPHGADLQYLFGFPMLNDTWQNLTGIYIQDNIYDYLDFNISQQIMTMWTEFARRGNSTPELPDEGPIRKELLRNVTWQAYNPSNLTFLVIDEVSYHDINYRQDDFAFWRFRFNELVSLIPLFTTPMPTPPAYPDYFYATYALTAAVVLLLLIIIGISIAVCRRKYR